jgi:leucine dehydrogenase
MKAVLDHLDGTTDLAGFHIVVSGVGKVGTALVRHLVEERAVVTVADVNEAAVARVICDFDVAAVPVDQAHTVVCDIFAPCALGGVLNERTIPALKCRAVAGSANNQLASTGDVVRLADRGVVYAPDFVVNAGGIINIADELDGYHRERAYGSIRRIFDTTRAVLLAARTGETTTDAAASAIARHRIEEVGKMSAIRSFPDAGRAGRSGYGQSSTGPGPAATRPTARARCPNGARASTALATSAGATTTTMPNPRLNTRAISSSLTWPACWIAPKMGGTCHCERFSTP